MNLDLFFSFNFNALFPSTIYGSFLTLLSFFHFLGGMVDKAPHVSEFFPALRFSLVRLDCRITAESNCLNGGVSGN